MVKRRIEIILEDEEEAFIRWMAKRDRVPYRMELNMIFSTELRALMDLYYDEMKMEVEKDA